MPLVPITVVARSPLAFPERKVGVQFRKSLPYVPGATIYGALGALLGRTLDQAAFDRLFRQIRCHNAYPAYTGDPWVRPLPMTAIQPKGVDDLSPSDSLVAKVCWERQRPAALIYQPTDADGRPWESAGQQFYTLSVPEATPELGGWLQKAQFQRRKVDQRVLTRVAINRRRGTAEDTRLYSPLVISEVMQGRDKELTETRFLGSIVVPEGDEHLLAALGDITHIGGRQTTGIGAVWVEQRAPAADLLSLKERVALMSERFGQQIELYQALGGRWRADTGEECEPPKTFFTIDLLSDAILLEEGWLPTNELSQALLRGLTGIDATLLRSFANTATVGGWNVSWQRPKPSAIATTMGSVFVFGVAGELADDDYAALAHLETAGIGERRAEGYGQVRICDEFHLLPSSEEAE